MRSHRAMDNGAPRPHQTQSRNTTVDTEVPVPIEHTHTVREEHEAGIAREARKDFQ